MLVLSRKIGERIHVGDNVTVEIRRIAGNRVTIAIEAPREMRILRGELKDAATAFDEPVEAPAVVAAPQHVAIPAAVTAALHDAGGFPHTIG